MSARPLSPWAPALAQNFTYWQDPGHGWLEVPVALLRELQIEGRISSYSYRSKDGLTAYLEEDCDAAQFVHAMKLQRGVTVVTDEQHRERIFIRQLPPFTR